MCAKAPFPVNLQIKGGRLPDGQVNMSVPSTDQPDLQPNTENADASACTTSITTAAEQPRRVFSSSVSGIVFHPMLVKLDMREGIVVGWACNAIPEGGLHNYTCTHLGIRAPELIMPYPDLVRLRMASRTALMDWLMWRGVSIEHPACALFDSRDRKLYCVNMLAKKHGKACLVLTFYTQRRIARRTHKDLLQYANQIHSVCVEQYAMCATTLIISIFYKDAHEGGGIGINAISRQRDQVHGDHTMPRRRRLQAIMEESLRPEVIHYRNSLRRLQEPGNQSTAGRP